MMGQNRQLRAADGFNLGAYEAKPSGKAKGGVVVIQEIFGVNSHIREVCDGYAKDGYVAIAPQIFDRIERNIELGYGPDDMTQGIGLARGKLKMDQTLQDLQAGIDAASKFGKVATVGYCFGGLLAWLSACELSGLACSASYYGGGVAGEANRKPKCPVIMHFGEKDAHISMSDVEKVKKAQPGVQVYTYDADHGFNCDHRASYDAKAAALAKERTLAFFAKYV
jgi:carboxymethylenebutenolidase